MERCEEFGEVFFGDAGTLVDDLEPYVVSRVGDGQSDRSVGAGVAYSIVE